MVGLNRPLYLILGESGSGKDTLVAQVCDIMRVSRVVSYTTRPRRAGEADTHAFVSDAYFDDLLAVGQMAATTTYDGHRYGATWAQIWDSDLYIIDPAGAKTLDRNKLTRPVYEVFINTTPAERTRHMRARGDSEEQIAARLEHDAQAFSDYRAQRSWDRSIASGSDVVISLACYIASKWPRTTVPA